MNSFFHAKLAEDDNRSPKEITDDIESVAYTWFGRPNYVYSKEAQKYWIGLTKDTLSGTTQHILEYDIKTDTYTFNLVGTTYEKDDHNQAQILIRNQDKRLLTVYTRHVDTEIRYRVSNNPLDGSSWGTEQIIVPGTKFSYPSPYQASNGDIFIFFRDRIVVGDEKWAYIKSSNGGRTFSNQTVLVDNGINRPYNITHQEGDILHFVMTSGSPQSDPELDINIYHFTFNLLTEEIKDSSGNNLTYPISSSNATLVKAFVDPERVFILDIITKNGMPRILYVLYPKYQSDDYADKDLYFIEFNGVSWVNNTKIAGVMNGFIEEDEEIQTKPYSGASRFKIDQPDIIIMPKEVKGILELHKVNLSDNPITIKQLTYNSPNHNWRPLAINSPVNNIIYLQNRYYNFYYEDFSIRLKTLTI